jgi:hypothetical protein
MWKTILVLILGVVALGVGSAAAEVVLKQIVSREHPHFDAARASLTVGRDGDVNWFAESNPETYLELMPFALACASPRLPLSKMRSILIHGCAMRRWRRVPGEWQTVRVDLWKLLQKPARIQTMYLAARGGAVGFDEIVLGRSEADLDNARKPSR